MKARQRKKRLYSTITPQRDCLGCFEWGDPLPMPDGLVRGHDDLLPPLSEEERAEADRVVAQNKPAFTITSTGDTFGSFQ